MVQRLNGSNLQYRSLNAVCPERELPLGAGRSTARLVAYRLERCAIPNGSLVSRKAGSIHLAAARALGKQLPNRRIVT